VRVGQGREFYTQHLCYTTHMDSTSLNAASSASPSHQYIASTQAVCILGRQPALGLAELESLYGAAAVTPLGNHAASLQIYPSAVDFARLGGSTRLATTLLRIPSTNWKHIEKALITLARSPNLSMPADGKFHLGLSAYGFDMTPAKLNAAALTLKKIIRARGLSVRVVPNNALTLDTAQVYHSHLVDDNGAELLIINGRTHTVIARSVAVQDIASYTQRDRERPKRDARVGMLPPKLAQIIINMAVGTLAATDMTTTDSGLNHNARDHQTVPNLTILDPFCGTGVVLQEALRMGYQVYGSDLEPRMISYSHTNIDWFIQTANLHQPIVTYEVGDATSHTWDLTSSKSSIHVASETYLGRPFTAMPSRDILEQTVSEVNIIIKKFLRNLHNQLPIDSRLCLAVPAWQTAPDTFHRLPLIDSLAQLGYNRVSFEHIANKALLYYRPNQTVARELLVLTTTN
jgi:SAM-dependent methyltransferase